MAIGGAFKFSAPFSRRMPDPVLKGAQRHIMMVRAEDVPEGLPKDPNPRAQRIDRGIYRDVRDSLLNENGSSNVFHLKNKGITLIADSVKEIDDQTYEVSFQPGQGIVDGGHTYEVALSGRSNIMSQADSDSPITQFIKFEILTGVPGDLWPEIAGGLNTAVQVQTMSLANLEHEFDWIRKLLKDEPYFDKIAFRENEKNTPHDVRDIIVLLEMFNVFDFPNDGEEHPTRAYNNKSEVLSSYLSNRKKYEQLGPILKDILRLHDHISMTARDLHNRRGGKAGHLTFVEKKARGKYAFTFIGRQGEYRLHRAALFPMLGAFRWMVTEKNGKVAWRGGLERVLDVWDSAGSELMRATQATNDEFGKKLTALGKSRNHWSTLHSNVAKYDLTTR